MQESAGWQQQRNTRNLPVVICILRMQPSLGTASLGQNTLQVIYLFRHFLPIHNNTHDCVVRQPVGCVNLFENHAREVIDFSNINRFPAGCAITALELITSHVVVGQSEVPGCHRADRANRRDSRESRWLICIANRQCDDGLPRARLHIPRDLLREIADEICVPFFLVRRSNC